MNYFSRWWCHRPIYIALCQNSHIPVFHRAFIPFVCVISSSSSLWMQGVNYSSWDFSKFIRLFETSEIFSGLRKTLNDFVRLQRLCGTLRDFSDFFWFFSEPQPQPTAQNRKENQQRLKRSIAVVEKRPIVLWCAVRSVTYKDRVHCEALWSHYCNRCVSSVTSPVTMREEQGVNNWS